VRGEVRLQKWTKEDPLDPLQRDHILSQGAIADINAAFGGAAKHLDRMLTMEENFQLLPRKLNASKHDNMGAGLEERSGSGQNESTHSDAEPVGASKAAA
jgi:hypothetical protein